MAKLIYSAFTSLDGYVADETGNFDWAELDEEVHAFINSLERQIGTYLFGRKMYETMAVWETPDVIPHRTAAVLEFAPIWQAAEKIVYSTTLQTVSTAKTRLERKFEADVVRKLKAGATREVRWAVRRSQRMPFELALSTNITYSSRRSSPAAAIPICQARSP
jgi:dihydrofolate reductase